LEKSRIVHQADAERNYHVFFQMLAGLSDEEKNALKLPSSEHFIYLNQSKHSSPLSYSLSPPSLCIYRNM
jgi:myosin heavy subunit